MSNIYNLTQQIHEQLQRIGEEKGVKFEIKSDFLIQFNGAVSYKEYNQIYSDEFLPLIAEKQIKQILVALEEVLGENMYFNKMENWIENKEIHDAQYFKMKGEIKYIAKSQAENLYQKWLCGFPQSEFEVNPEKVLVELLEVLKSI